MFKAIVVGTDGSEGASRAVTAAAELAATQPEAVLHIVTVQKPVSAGAVAVGEMAASAPVAAERTWEEEVKSELELTLARARDDQEILRQLTEVVAFLTRRDERLVHLRVVPSGAQRGLVRAMRPLTFTRSPAVGVSVPS